MGALCCPYALFKHHIDERIVEVERAATTLHDDDTDRMKGWREGQAFRTRCLLLYSFGTLDLSR